MLTVKKTNLSLKQSKISLIYKNRRNAIFLYTIIKHISIENCFLITIKEKGKYKKFKKPIEIS